MAYAKKTSKVNEAFQKLKNDLAAGTAGNAYIFYGEETYLREYYLKELRKKLVPAGFEEFNYHTLEGKDLTVPPSKKSCRIRRTRKKHKELPRCRQNTNNRIWNFNRHLPFSD